MNDQLEIGSELNSIRQLAQTGYGRVLLSHMYSMLLVSEHGGEFVESHKR